VWNDYAPTVSGAPGTALDRQALGWEGRRFLAGAVTADRFAGAPGAQQRSPVRVFAGVGHAPGPELRVALALDELDRLGGLGRRVLVVASPTGSGYVNTAALAAVELLTRGDCASIAVQVGTARSQASVGLLADAARAIGLVLDGLAARLDGRQTRPRVVVWAESFGAWALLHELASGRDTAAWHGLVDAWLVVGPPGPALADAAQRAALDGLAASWPVAADLAGVPPARSGARGVMYVHADDPVAHVPGASLAWRPQRHHLPAPAGKGQPLRRYRRRWLPVLTALRARADVDEATLPGGPAGMHRPHDYRYAATRLLASVLTDAEALRPVSETEQLVVAAEHLSDAQSGRLGPDPVAIDPWR
jgi:uncharacterized membrane protein